MKTHHSKSFKRQALATLAAATLCGCATSEPPTKSTPAARPPLEPARPCGDNQADERHGSTRRLAPSPGRVPNSRKRNKRAASLSFDWGAAGLPPCRRRNPRPGPEPARRLHRQAGRRSNDSKSGSRRGRSFAKRRPSAHGRSLKCGSVGVCPPKLRRRRPNPSRPPSAPRVTGGGTAIDRYDDWMAAREELKQAEAGIRYEQHRLQTARERKRQLQSRGVEIAEEITYCRSKVTRAKVKLNAARTANVPTEIERWSREINAWEKRLAAAETEGRRVLEELYGGDQQPEKQPDPQAGRAPSRRAGNPLRLGRMNTSRFKRLPFWLAVAAFVVVTTGCQTTRVHDKPWVRPDARMTPAPFRRIEPRAASSSRVCIGRDAPRRVFIARLHR